MKTMLVAEASEDSRRAKQLLEADGHEVQWCQSVPQAAASLNEVPKFIVVDLGAARGESLSFVREIRSRPADHYPYIVGLVGALSDPELMKAYDAGFDYTVAKPVPDQALTRCTRVGTRIAFWKPGVAVFTGKSASAAAPETPAGAAAAPAPPGSTEDLLNQVSRSAAWNASNDVIEKSTAGFLMLPVTVHPRREPSRKQSAGCTIQLSNPDLAVELQISVSSDDKSLGALAVHLFGEDDAELAADVVRELANIQMGGFKTAFKKESINFVGGLPTDCEPNEAALPSSLFHRFAAYTLDVNGAEISVHLGFRSKANSFHNPGELRESMVIVNDIFNPRGMLLIAAGTRLSERMIERVRATIPPQTRIEVMCA